MKPRIFVSSTFFDLKSLREEVYSFIKQYGFEPIESETGDIGFVPWENLDASCYSTMKDCDMTILIIGGRYGSPKSGEKISDFEEYISVTREEFRTAVENGIPIYAFVENNVFVEYELYKSNLNNPSLMNIIFRATDNINVFRFISEIYSIGSITVTSFSKNHEIKDYLQSQWSALFKKYINSLRDEKRIASIETAVTDMKSLIKKMDIMLNAVGKKVLIDDNEYSEILERQDIMEICELLTEYIGIIFYDDEFIMNKDTNINFLLDAIKYSLEKEENNKEKDFEEYFEEYYLKDKNVSHAFAVVLHSDERDKLNKILRNLENRKMLYAELFKDSNYNEIFR